MKVRVRNASSERYQDIGWTEDWRGTGMWVPVTIGGMLCYFYRGNLEPAP